VDELAREYEDRDLPLPDWWGGYRLRPESYEFWQHRDDRLHDRFRYRRDGGEWILERLAP
jgi:pyridoxamine 5'-phosphate oxidase